MLWSQNLSTISRARAKVLYYCSPARSYWHGIKLKGKKKIKVIICRWPCLCVVYQQKAKIVSRSFRNFNQLWFLLSYWVALHKMALQLYITVWKQSVNSLWIRFTISKPFAQGTLWRCRKCLPSDAHAIVCKLQGYCSLEKCRVCVFLISARMRLKDVVNVCMEESSKNVWDAQRQNLTRWVSHVWILPITISLCSVLSISLPRRTEKSPHPSFPRLAHSLFESSHFELKSTINLAFALIIPLTLLRILHLSYLLNIFLE